MYIRLKFGRHAGEIRDVQAEAARGLLNTGRAEDPYAPVAEVRAELSDTLQSKLELTTPKRSRKAKP